MRTVSLLLVKSNNRFSQEKIYISLCYSDSHQNSRIRAGSLKMHYYGGSDTHLVTFLKSLSIIGISNTN